MELHDEQLRQVDIYFLATTIICSLSTLNNDENNTVKKVSFEWSHHRISSNDSKVGTTLQYAITHFSSEKERVV